MVRPPARAISTPRAVSTTPAKPEETPNIHDRTKVFPASSKEKLDPSLGHKLQNPKILLPIVETGIVCST
jgi:hypothetical protein